MWIIPFRYIYIPIGRWCNSDTLQIFPWFFLYASLSLFFSSIFFPLSNELTVGMHVSARRLCIWNCILTSTFYFIFPKKIYIKLFHPIFGHSAFSISFAQFIFKLNARHYAIPFTTATMRLFQNIIIIISKSNLSFFFLLRRQHLVHDGTDCHSNTWVRFRLSDLTLSINKRHILKWIGEHNSHHLLQSKIVMKNKKYWTHRRRRMRERRKNANETVAKVPSRQRHWLCEWYNYSSDEIK